MFSLFVAAEGLLLSHPAPPVLCVEEALLGSRARLEMSSMPVSHLYTPQQLNGSLRFGSGVRLGNWREDDALDDERMMDYVKKRDEMGLTILKKQMALGPQLSEVSLSAAPADGLLHFGDRFLLKSEMNDSTLAVSLGQKLNLGDSDVFGVFGSPKMQPMARNTVTILR